MRRASYVEVFAFLDTPASNWLPNRIVNSAVHNFPKLMKTVVTKYNLMVPSRMAAILDILVTSPRLSNVFIFSEILDRQLLAYTPFSRTFAENIIQK